jgi:hypothetical protein
MGDLCSPFLFIHSWLSVLEKQVDWRMQTDVVRKGANVKEVIKAI